MQLKEPIVPSATLDYACLPPALPSVEWHEQLPSELEAWGWGQRDSGPYNPSTLPNRLQHTPVLTRAPAGWSDDVRDLTDYSSVAYNLDFNFNLYYRLKYFYLLAVSQSVNGTTQTSDSGTGVVFRRRSSGGEGGLLGDVLYGVNFASESMRYSMNVSGGEPEIRRWYSMATAIQLAAGGSSTIVLYLTALHYCRQLTSFRSLLLPPHMRHWCLPEDRVTDSLQTQWCIPATREGLSPGHPAFSTIHDWCRRTSVEECREYFLGQDAVGADNTRASWREQQAVHGGCGVPTSHGPHTALSCPSVAAVEW